MLNSQNQKHNRFYVRTPEPKRGETADTASSVLLRMYLLYELLLLLLLLFVTRTEGISVRVIRMPSQPVGFGPVEQLDVK